MEAKCLWKKSVKGQIHSRHSVIQCFAILNIPKWVYFLLFVSLKKWSESTADTVNDSCWLHKMLYDAYTNSPLVHIMMQNANYLVVTPNYIKFGSIDSQKSHDYSKIFKYSKNLLRPFKTTKFLKIITSTSYFYQVCSQTVRAVLHRILKNFRNGKCFEVGCKMFDWIRK